MKELIEEHKKALILITSLFGILILLFIITKIINRDDNRKMIQGEDYVYTLQTDKSSEEDIESKLPQINLNGENIEEINEEIMDYYMEIMVDSRNSFVYGYKVNKDTISLLIKTRKYEYDDELYEMKKTNYKSYNIDMKTGNLIDNEELFQKNNINTEEIEKIINDRLEQLYNKDVNSKIIDKKECDLDCYLDIRMYEEKNNVYTIEDNHLVVYITAQVGQDNPNFSEEDFRILIK